MAAQHQRPIIALGALALQHCAFTGLVLRTTLFADLYDFPTTALFAAEALRLAASTILHTYSQPDSSPTKTLSAAFESLPKLSKVAVPAALLVAKQWLQHSAIQRLGVTQYSIISQIELLITAVIVILLLRKQIGQQQWASIALLTVGAILTQFPAAWLLNLQQHRHDFLLGGNEFAEGLKPIGILHAVAAAATSALAYVSLEKQLKEGKGNVWIVNIQMAILSGAFIALSGYAFGGNVAVFESVDKDAVRGWDVESRKSLLALLFVGLSAAGGILQTVAIAVTDNILKGFATSSGLVLMGVASFLFRDWVPSYLSALGTILVVVATYGYTSVLPASQWTPVGLPSSAKTPTQTPSSSKRTFVAVLLLLYLLIIGLDIFRLKTDLEPRLTQQALEWQSAIEKANQPEDGKKDDNCNLNSGRGDGTWFGMTEEDRKVFFGEDPWSERDTRSEEKEVGYIKYIARRVAVNDTVVFIPTNDNFIELAMNLECSLRRQGITNILFWALDAGSNFALKARGLPVYFNPSLYGTSRCVNYHAPDYNRMMRERPKVWKWFLQAGINFLWMDADISMLGNPFKALRYDVDLEIQSDGQSNLTEWVIAKGGPAPNPPWGGCAGLFHLRSTPRSIKIMQEMQSLMLRDKEIEDQQALGTLIGNKTLTHIVGSSNANNDPPTLREAKEKGLFLARFVDPRKWVNGHQLNNGVELDEGGSGWVWKKDGKVMRLETPLAVHANGMTGKKKMFESRKAWFLDEEGRCQM